MEDERKHIKLTDEEYRELLKAVVLGNHVTDAVSEIRKEKRTDHRRLQNYLLSYAAEFASADFAELVKDELMPAREVDEEVHSALDDFTDDEFWHRLKGELGERDLWEAATPGERATIEASGLWPERVKELYEKYHKEFEDRGLDHLRLVEGRPERKHKAHIVKQQDDNGHAA